MDIGSIFSVDKVFTNEECDRIVREFSNKCRSSETVNKSNARKSKHVFIEHNNETDWIYMRLASFASYFNNEKFKFNIDNKFQNLQFTKYDTGDYYTWHVDTGPSPDTCIRKLSISVQLSDPTRYTGGDLQFGNVDEDLYTASREKGSVTIFPSIVRHRGTPIKSGERYSIVAWGIGAPFQ